MAKKNLKGLSSDTRPSDQPQETYPFGKNGIQDWKKLAQINEPGFTISSAQIPYTMMGCIPTDNFPIIFSTDDTHSAVGFFDIENDVYTPIIDDTSEDYKLGFKRANYITGEYQKSNKGDYIAVFTDKVLPLRWLNCTNPDITKTEDLLFFLRSVAPTLTVSTESGGQLLTGSYLVFVKYAREDGSETPYLTSSIPVIVSGADGSGTSSKAIRIHLTGCDTSYDYVVISIIKKINGVTTAEQLEYVTLSSTVDILYTGNNTTTPITTEEVLIPPAIYSRVGTLTQLNGELFLGNLNRLPAINYQKYAALIQVRWVSKEVDMNNIPETILNGLEKGFAHGETVALYIRLKMNDGSKSKAFTIAGRAPISGEETTITDSGVTGKRYQIHDTVLYPNALERSGTPGLWLNQDELYPDTEDFDSTSIGGPNLRGQKVRHHCMPTHHWIMKNFNAGDPTYGKSKLDILGLRLSGVVIPPDIIDQVDSYEILYAKRTTGNMTVLGQSAVIYAAQSLKLQQTNAQNNFQSTAGNWKSIADISTFRDFNKASEGPMYLSTDRVRMHPFELLFNKLEIPQNDCYLQFEWQLSVDNIAYNTISYGFDTNIPPGDRRPEDAKPVVYNIDYKENPASKVFLTDDSKYLRKFAKIQYAPNNVNGGEWNNTQIETSVVGRLTQAGPSLAISSQRVSVGEKRMKNFNPADMVQFEQIYVATIRVLRNNVYDSVLSQSLVSTGKSYKTNLSITDEIYAGDVFPCDYTSHTYGWDSEGNGETGLGDQTRAGTKVIRRIVCESIANINQRYEIAGNNYSKWYPHNAIGYQDAYIMDFQRSLDPNQFGYSKDLNSLNDFESIAIFKPGEPDITGFPYRVHRGGVFKRQGKPGSWRTFLALDYYEQPKNRGVIINLCGFDDALLIHHESALFITQDKATLGADIIKVTLGTADIFQYAPQEVLASSLGYAGTHHDLGCVLTPMGYLFVDNRSGEVFVFKRTLKILNANINNFLREYSKVLDVNSYVGNGITIGYDPQYKRALLTIKNNQLITNKEDIVPAYEETPEFFSQLESGVSIVYHRGTWMKFMGGNTTPYDCTADADPPVVTVDPEGYTIPERSPSDTVVGTLTITDPLPVTVVLVSGNDGGAFLIVNDGTIKVANPILNYEVKDEYTIGVRVINSAGLYTDVVVTIEVTDVNDPPYIPDYITSVNENSSNGSAVVTVVGTDEDSDTLSYSIVGGNPLGTFAINASTGVITVLDNTSLDFESHPQFVLQIQVSDGVLTGSGTVTVNVVNVNEGPVGTGADATIYDTATVGTLVITGTPATDPDGEAQTLTYTLQFETVPGKFTVGIDPEDPTTFLKVKVAGALSDDVYQVIVRATDNGVSPMYVDLIYNITVIPVPAYWNTEQSRTFNRDNCAEGSFGTSVKYTVAAHTYSSPTSIAAANALAVADIDANGQTYANTNGTCVAPAPIDCGDPSSYSGGEAYPTPLSMTAAVTGSYTANFDGLSIPDKLIIKVNGAEVLNSGYRGDSTYQSGLNSALAARGLPPETITGTGVYSNTFSATAGDTIIAEVFGPMIGTAWDLEIVCPTEETFENVEKSGTFTKSNCPEGYTGSAVLYVVPAGTYTASTQIAADALAQDDVDDNGQAYADSRDADDYCTIVDPGDNVSVGYISTGGALTNAHIVITVIGTGAVVLDEEVPQGPVRYYSIPPGSYQIEVTVNSITDNFTVTINGNVHSSPSGVTLVYPSETTPLDIIIVNS